MADNNPYEFRQDPGQGQQVILPPQTIAKPTSVTVFGVLSCVFGGLGIVCTPFSLLGLFIGDLFPMIENPVQIAPEYKIFLIIASVIGVGMSVWLLSLGVGLLKFKAWARRGSVIYACIVIVWSIVGTGLNIAAYSLGWMTAPQGQMPGMLGGMCGGIVGLIYPVLLLIFMLSPKVKQAFATIGG